MNKDKLFFVFAFILVSQLPAHAYLDPGTGNMVLQVVIAAFAGIACWIKIQWNNIKIFFSNKFTNKK